MGKSRKPNLSLEEKLQAALEMIGWQAELVRAALREVREHSAGKERRSRAGLSGPKRDRPGRSGCGTPDDLSVANSGGGPE